MKRFTYRCSRCGHRHPYTYSKEQVTAAPERACIWGGCSGTAHVVEA